MRKYLIVPATALGIIATAGFAFAADDDDDRSTAASRDQWMTIAQITEQLTAQGYDVRDLTAEGNGYELKAIDKDGNRVETHVDPVTGALLASDSDD